MKDSSKSVIIRNIEKTAIIKSQQINMIRRMERCIPRSNMMINRSGHSKTHE